MHHKMKTIRSQRHQLGSYEINKVSLSCFDDKRYILDNGQESYAYGLMLFLITFFLIPLAVFPPFSLSLT